MNAQEDARGGDDRSDGCDTQPDNQMSRFRAAGNRHDPHQRQRSCHVTGREGVRDGDLDLRCELRMGGRDHLLPDSAGNPH
jgi:hypothetical protein